MRDPVPAAHERRQEAARQLVLALRAGLETGQAFAQAVVDALVVAGLEMQAGHRFGRRPSSGRTGCRRRAGTARRRSAAPSRSARNSTRADGIAAARCRRKSSVSAGWLPYSAKVPQIEAMHRGQIGFAGLVALDDAERHAGARDLGAFLADVLAVLVIEGREIVVEVFQPAVVAPVVLHVDARQPVVVERRLVLIARWKLTCADDRPLRAAQLGHRLRPAHADAPHRAPAGAGR